MTCAHLQAIEAGCDTAFTVDASRVTFGAGALREVGDRIRAHGVTRVALVTDRYLRALPWFDEVVAALGGLDVAIFDGVAIEPTDASLEDAIRFARDARCDGYVSLGGGSVIDTAKIANLYASHPAPLAAYVNAPLGDGRPVPGPLAPHIAVPTTSGTGSEVTGIAIFDWHAHRAKTGISSPRLRPTEALVDPRVTATRWSRSPRAPIRAGRSPRRVPRARARIRGATSAVARRCGCAARTSRTRWPATRTRASR